MAQDIFSSLKNYANKLSGGEKSPADIAAALKGWVEESGEVIKEKIETEIEAAAARMGFIRQSDLDPLLKRIADLEAAAQLGAAKVSTPRARAKKVAAKPAKASDGVKSKPANKSQNAAKKSVKKAVK